MTQREDPSPGRLVEEVDEGAHCGAGVPVLANTVQVTGQHGHRTEQDGDRQVQTHHVELVLQVTWG